MQKVETCASKIIFIKDMNLKQAGTVNMQIYFFFPLAFLILALSSKPIRITMALM